MTDDELHEAICDVVKAHRDTTETDLTKIKENTSAQTRPRSTYQRPLTGGAPMPVRRSESVKFATTPEARDRYLEAERKRRAAMARA